MVVTSWCGINEQIRANPLIYQQLPRVKTALEMLRASEELEQHLDEVINTIWVSILAYYWSCIL